MRGHVLHGPINLFEYEQGRALSEVDRASGVYLWCVQPRPNFFMVRYVGQTNRSFAIRLKEECVHDRVKNRERWSIVDYGMGRMALPAEQIVESQHYFDECYKLTWLFFIPIIEQESPYLGIVSKRASLFKPAESAIIRQLCRHNEAREFLWNARTDKKGAEDRKSGYPMRLHFVWNILGLPQEITD